MKEINLFNKLVDKFGIILDSDPRHTTLRGQEQAASTTECTPRGKTEPDTGNTFTALSEEDLGMIKELLLAGMSATRGSWEATSRIYRG